MIQLQPAPQAARRFAVVCSGFTAERSRRQPWHMADGIARGLSALGHDVWLLTDLAGPMSPTPYAVEPLSALLTQRSAPAASCAPPWPRAGRSGVSADRRRAARPVAPARPGCTGVPAHGQPAPAAARAAAAGRARACGASGRCWRCRCSTRSCPVRCCAPVCAAPGRRELIYLSQAARERYSRPGPAARSAAAGRRSTRQRCCRRRPRAGRSASAISARHWRPVAPIWRSRRSSRQSPLGSTGGWHCCSALTAARPAVARLLARIERSPQRDRIDCRVGMLSAEELRAELARCHAFLLPFRVTISEVPLVVIEAGLSGRPTIVLAAPGVDEIAQPPGRDRRRLARRPARGAAAGGDAVAGTAARRRHLD